MLGTRSRESHSTDLTREKKFIINNSDNNKINRNDKNTHTHKLVPTACMYVHAAETTQSKASTLADLYAVASLDRFLHALHQHAVKLLQWYVHKYIMPKVNYGPRTVTF